MARARIFPEASVNFWELVCINGHSGSRAPEPDLADLDLRSPEPHEFPQTDTRIKHSSIYPCTNIQHIRPDVTMYRVWRCQTRARTISTNFITTSAFTESFNDVRSKMHRFDVLQIDIIFCKFGCSRTHPRKRCTRACTQLHQNTNQLWHHTNRLTSFPHFRCILTIQPAGAAGTNQRYFTGCLVSEKHDLNQTSIRLAEEIGFAPKARS